MVPPPVVTREARVRGRVWVFTYMLSSKDVTVSGTVTDVGWVQAIA